MSFEENEVSEIDLVANASPINWVNKGAVNGIKNQMACGLCFGFSAVASMEAAHQIKSGKLLSFSEQQILDCAPGSCSGGNYASSFAYYETSYAMTENSYPYTHKLATCQYKSGSNTGVKSTGHSSVTKNSPDAMKTAVSKGVVSVSVNASPSSGSFQNYKTGIYNEKNCGDTVNHAVNIVGHYIWRRRNGGYRHSDQCG